MKRRRILQSLLVAPAAPALLGQPPASQNSRPAPTSPSAPALNPSVPLAPNSQTPGPAAESTTLTTTIPDVAAETNIRFFTPAQFAALRKLADIIMPPLKGAPGALTAEAPEFLDFLLSESSKDRQQLYRTGLDQLNGQAQRQFHKPFAEVDDTQAATLLAPLRQPWTYEPPADPLARFLQAAKVDIRTATINSREYSASAGTTGGGGGGRRFGSAGLYWYPLD